MVPMPVAELDIANANERYVVKWRDIITILAMHDIPIPRPDG